MRALFLVLGIAGAAIGACGDPVHDNEVSALGPEQNGVRPGPTHRPGQPCLVCHDGSGPGNQHFSIAGTVFAVKGQSDPFPGATVHLTDATGATRNATTNEVGNFFINYDNWAPTFPLHVELDVGDTTVSMNTHIGRDGSCAACHFDPPGPTSPGRVYVAVDPQDLPGAGGM